MFSWVSVLVVEEDPEKGSSMSCINQIKVAALASLSALWVSYGSDPVQNASGVHSEEESRVVMQDLLEEEEECLLLSDGEKNAKGSLGDGQEDPWDAIIIEEEEEDLSESEDAFHVALKKDDTSFETLLSMATVLSDHMFQLRTLLEGTESSPESGGRMVQGEFGEVFQQEASRLMGMAYSKLAMFREIENDMASVQSLPEEQQGTLVERVQNLKKDHSALLCTLQTLRGQLSQRDEEIKTLQAQIEQQKREIESYRSSMSDIQESTRQKGDQRDSASYHVFNLNVDDITEEEDQQK